LCIAIQEEGNGYAEERQTVGKDSPFIAVKWHSRSQENQSLCKLMIVNV